MMKADVYNKKYEKVGTVDVPERVFNVRWNADLVHQAVRTQMANGRPTVAHTKFRGEVSGGGKKPWRQKGTGRARHGSNRSPIWVGGGITHGPRAERSYELKINKKMRQKALFTILSRRLKEGEVVIVDSLDITEPKSKVLANALAPFMAEKDQALIIPTRDKVEGFARASRNIKGVKSLDPESLNAYDLLRYKQILLDKGAIEVIDTHYHACK